MMRRVASSEGRHRATLNESQKCANERPISHDLMLANRVRFTLAYASEAATTMGPAKPLRNVNYSFTETGGHTTSDKFHPGSKWVWMLERERHSTSRLGVQRAVHSRPSIRRCMNTTLHSQRRCYSVDFKVYSRTKHMLASD